MTDFQENSLGEAIKASAGGAGEWSDPPKTDFEAIAKWALSGRVGASSKCIAQHMVGLPCDGSYPHDSGDFQRCEALLDAVPSLRKRLPEMAAVNQYWAALAPHWDDIRQSTDKTEAIRRIVRPIESADSRVVLLGEGVTMRFGSIRD